MKGTRRAEGLMRIATCLLGLLAVGSLAVEARRGGAQPVDQGRDRNGLVQRFLSASDRPLVSYRAIRRLSAVTRGGKMNATLTVRTSLGPDTGFQYEVLEETGSGMIRSKVLHAALEAERDARRKDQTARAALTEANYRFTPGEVTPDGLARVAISPKRKDVMLVEGSILLTHEEADLVRIEGLLVKRPSFWTRRVEIVRRYRRIAGVRVPVAMGSTADVLFAGKSTFTMDYEYESINGSEVPRPER
jgi:hypothetical protein